MHQVELPKRLALRLPNQLPNDFAVVSARSLSHHLLHRLPSITPAFSVGEGHAPAICGSLSPRPYRKDHSKDHRLRGLRSSSTVAHVGEAIAWQIEQEMMAQKLTKTAMATKMRTSRASLNRLLDENDTSLTLTTLAGAAAALGRRIKLELAPA